MNKWSFGNVRHWEEEQRKRDAEHKEALRLLAEVCDEFHKAANAIELICEQAKVLRESDERRMSDGPNDD